MKVIILSSSDFGTAAHHLPLLMEHKEIEIAAVIVSEGRINKNARYYLRRLKKISKIGILGAMNGKKMRSWYRNDCAKYCNINDLSTYCIANHISYHRVPTTNSSETIEIFKSSGADLGLSLGNGFISPRVFSIPKYGMLNIHHELLPEYQNAQSIIWELYNGSTITGYTIHKIEKTIDTGAIVYRESLPIIFRDTLADTVAFNYACLYDASAIGLINVLLDFEKYYNTAEPQGKGTKYTTPSFFQFRKIEKMYKKLKSESLQKNIANQ